MSKIVYIGADGGGTKTAIAASAFPDKAITCEGASINYNVIGVEKAADNFAKAVKKLTLPADVQIAGVAIGDPSIDDLVPSPMTEKFISLIREYIPLSQLCPVYVKSDAYMTLYGMTGEKPGVLMISGTGSMGIAVDAGGALHVTGGWGRLVENEGSGYFIAVNGIKAALRYYEGTGPETILLEEMKRYFTIENPRDFILRYYADKKVFPDIAGFAKNVGEAAENDREALKIIQKCSDMLIEGTLALLKKANLNDCNIGIYGSVLLQNSLVRKRFENGVIEVYPQVEIVVPAMKPEIAALKYVIEKRKKK